MSSFTIPVSVISTLTQSQLNDPFHKELLCVCVCRSGANINFKCLSLMQERTKKRQGTQTGLYRLDWGGILFDSKDIEEKKKDSCKSHSFRLDKRSRYSAQAHLRHTVCAHQAHSWSRDYLDLHCHLPSVWFFIQTSFFVIFGNFNIHTMYKSNNEYTQ